MAKVSGGLFSVDAKGSIGGFLTFSRVTSGQVAKRLASPSNPQSVAQNGNRNAIRLASAIQFYIARATVSNNYFSSLDFTFLTQNQPLTGTWSTLLLSLLVPGGQAKIDSVNAAWLSIGGFNQWQYQQQAAIAGINIRQVVIYGQGNTVLRTISAGEVLYFYIYSMWQAGFINADISTAAAYTVPGGGGGGGDEIG